MVNLPTYRTNWLFEVLSNSFLFFLGPHLRHMEVPGLGVESKLQLPAYTTATAMPELRPVCDLCYYSSWQRRILNPLNKARDGTRILMDTSHVLNLLSCNGNSSNYFLINSPCTSPISLHLCFFATLLGFLFVCLFVCFIATGIATILVAIGSID